MDDPAVHDPLCDVAKPKLVSFNEVRRAASQIDGHVIRTPCVRSKKLSDHFRCDIYLKLEQMQITGSFKERGARNAMAKLPPNLGVICASAGNHGLGMAYHGQLMGRHVTVVMPRSAPLVKIQACKKSNATIVLEGANIGQSKQYAMQMAKEKDLVYVNGYDHPDVIAGQGTIGVEIVEQVPDLDAVLVPVGGGGLIAGVSVAVKTLNSNARVIGVETDQCTSFSNSMKAGKPVAVQLGSTLADGLAVPLAGCNSLATAMNYVDEMVTAPEDKFTLAICRLYEAEKVVVEGAGSAALAALLSNSIPEVEGKKIVLLLSGRNIDKAVLCNTISRGVALNSRLLRFTMDFCDSEHGVVHMNEIVQDLEAAVHDTKCTKRRNGHRKGRWPNCPFIRSFHEREFQGD